MEETSHGDSMDVDQCLIGKFSSMGTTDKDVLISEFGSLLGMQVDSNTCEFFLEMNNWNLQAAIGAYYDYKTPTIKTPQMAFISDVTIGEGESIPPNTNFIKTWQIQNTGDESWPFNCTLRFVNGDKMESPDWVSVGALRPGEVTNVSVKMRSPSLPGIYQGQWKMFSQSLVPFGDVIWVIITVEAGGLLGVTQQMSQFASFGGEGGVFDSNKHNNPFSVQDNNETDMMEINQPPQTESLQLASTKLLYDSRNQFRRDDNAMSMGNPYPSCWSEKSPTTCGPSDDLLGTRGHALTIINEENSASGSSQNWMSKSSYDLNASRQITPTGSPRRMQQIEDTLLSPEAPSPIRSNKALFSKIDKSIGSSHHLNFTSES